MSNSTTTIKHSYQDLLCEQSPDGLHPYRITVPASFVQQILVDGHFSIDIKASDERHAKILACKLIKESTYGDSFSDKNFVESCTSLLFSQNSEIDEDKMEAELVKYKDFKES